MKIIKTLSLAGFVLIMTLTSAFAAEVEVALNNSDTESYQAEIQTTVQDDADISQENLIEILEEPTVKKAMVNVDILNVRSGPSTETEKLGKLSFGEIVEI